MEEGGRRSLTKSHLFPLLPHTRKKKMSVQEREGRETKREGGSSRRRARKGDRMAFPPPSPLLYVLLTLCVPFRPLSFPWFPFLPPFLLSRRPACWPWIPPTSHRGRKVSSFKNGAKEGHPGAEGVLLKFEWDAAWCCRRTSKAIKQNDGWRGRGEGRGSLAPTPLSSHQPGRETPSKWVKIFPPST